MYSEEEFKQAVIEAWDDGYKTYDIQERFELSYNLGTPEDYYNNKYTKKI